MLFRRTSQLRGSPDGSVTVLIAGTAVPVRSVAAQPDGVDQIEIALPLALRGSGEVDVVVEVNGALSNTRRINVL